MLGTKVIYEFSSYELNPCLCTCLIGFWILIIRSSRSWFLLFLLFRFLLADPLICIPISSSTVVCLFPSELGSNPWIPSSFKALGVYPNLPKVLKSITLEDLDLRLPMVYSTDFVILLLELSSFLISYFFPLTGTPNSFSILSFIWKIWFNLWLLSMFLSRWPTVFESNFTSFLDLFFTGLGSIANEFPSIPWLVYTAVLSWTVSLTESLRLLIESWTGSFSTFLFVLDLILTLLLSPLWFLALPVRWEPSVLSKLSRFFVVLLYIVFILMNVSLISPDI